MTFQSDNNKSTFSASPYRSLGQPVSSGRLAPSEPRTLLEIVLGPVKAVLGSRFGLATAILFLAAAVIWLS